MLIYTRAMLDKIFFDVKRFSQFFTISSLIFSIGYMIYAMASGAGVLWVNILMTVISAAYLAFYVLTLEKKDKATKRVKKHGKKIFKYTKLTLKAYAVGVSVYGIYIASDKAGALATVLALVNLFVWALQVLFELLSLVVGRYKDLLLMSFQADIEAAVKPVKAVGDFVKKVTGAESEDDISASPSRKVLDGIVEKYKMRKASEESSGGIRKKIAEIAHRFESREEKEEETANK